MADCFGEIGNSSNYVETILKIRWLIKTSLKKPNPNPNFAEAKDNERKAYLLIRYIILLHVLFVFYCEATNISFWKVISLGGRWSDSKGSVITVNNTPSFPLFMLSSASAVVVPYPLSWWKVIHLLCLSLKLLSTGPRNIMLRFI